MKPQVYKCIKSDPSNGLIEGKPVKPYYEDEKEIIIEGFKMDHHVTKSGQYFADHLEIQGGNNR